MIARILSDPFAIFLVVLFFGASIFVHEYGHYLAARWRKLKVERFSIGFGPRLFGWRDKRGVDWRVSLIPLGGYVSLPQMADLQGVENSGRPEEAAEPLPVLSYTDKMVVAGAGAFFNVLFALALGCILWVFGTPVSEQFETTRIGYTLPFVVDADGIERESPAARAGLRPGDKIVTIDGRRMRDWQDVVYAITTGTRRSEARNPMSVIEVERGNERLTLTAFPVLQEFERIRQLGIVPANTLKVGAVMPDSPAAKVGLEKNDIITAANGIAMYHTMSLSHLINAEPETPLILTVQRAGRELQVPILAEQVVYNTDGATRPMLGIQWMPVWELRHINPVAQIVDAMRTTLRVLGALFHPRSDIGISNLSGPVGISYTIYIISQIGILEVLSIIVLININLAILNLLPIPVLDGGHMAFATFAKLRGRAVSPNVVASAQVGFMLMFLGIFIYVTFFDVGRVKRNETAILDSERAAARLVQIRFSGIEQPTAESLPPAEPER